MVLVSHALQESHEDRCLPKNNNVHYQRIIMLKTPKNTKKTIGADYAGNREHCPGNHRGTAAIITFCRGTFQEPILIFEVKSAIIALIVFTKCSFYQ